MKNQKSVQFEKESGEVTNDKSNIPDILAKF